MQISDAVSLILRAASHRENKTYILDMGKPYKIIDLAIKTIRHSQFGFDNDLIDITGLQAGEKLTEILFTSKESSALSTKDGMFVIADRADSLLSKDEMQSLFSGDIEFLYSKTKKLL